jgi:hypothetical protein
MADPINLNRARKAKAKADREVLAAENRVKFGRPKAEKLADRAETQRKARALDQTRREPKEEF